ncbi:sugar phosphate isomerase/epimerase [Paenibacillus sp. MZ04-78.2]|uniref:sugar phosphate isomerase/epimerase family protein n=1 Tax=Paenibacillus sp. MZ04-78.2 TaxID=2962034 RepID=UPI0020B7803A|nr:sugar phosphate isomerase/epimerase [Paenibacillus sp. MZ04-78.2]MCP3776041.1 sugar phosphate isomerase/epimerase [Paenibacillus sp. MZ04-78.2]
MSLQFGLQLYSVRDELEKDYWGTLEKLAEIGYRNLEIANHNAEDGLEPNATELRKRLDALGMKVVSSHISPLDRYEEIIAYNQELSCTAIALSIAFFKNKQEVLECCQLLNRHGEAYKKGGLDFYYHNHFQEFQQFDGQYVLDIILENTDKDLVKIEFDTYWAIRGGVDPIAYLQKLGDRCDLVHQKDLPASASPVNLLKVLGEDSDISFERFLTLHQADQFAEVGEGTLNIEEILNTVKQIGAAKYVFVEQDLTTRNQLESVAISYRNISKLFKA